MRETKKHSRKSLNTLIIISLLDEGSSPCIICQGKKPAECQLSSSNKLCFSTAQDLKMTTRRERFRNPPHYDISSLCENSRHIIVRPAFNSFNRLFYRRYKEKANFIQFRCTDPSPRRCTFEKNLVFST